MNRISEQWDFDLLKLIPQAEEIIAPVAGVRMVTYGSADKDDRLISPSVWNDYKGMIAFFGLLDGVGRASNGWKPQSFYSGGVIVLCSALEAFCDAWGHGYILLVEREPVWDTWKLRNLMMSLMYDARGVNHFSDQIRREKQNHVALSLRLAVSRLEDLIERLEVVTGVEIPMKTAGGGDAERSASGLVKPDSPHL